MAHVPLLMGFVSAEAKFHHDAVAFMPLYFSILAGYADVVSLDVKSSSGSSSAIAFSTC